MTDKLSIKQIKEICSQANVDNVADIEQRFSRDDRAGVVSAVASMKRRVDRELRENERLQKMYDFENDIRKQHGYDEHCLVIGLDEVGRGPLAGPCAIGAVVLNPRSGDARVSGVNDSKKLSEKKRRKISQQVKENALAWTIQYSDAHDIDEKGIAACLRDCFQRGIAECERQLLEKGIEDKLAIVLLDGNALHIDEREVNIIKGDGKSASIACASVIAKVDRDDLMCKLAEEYPQYGFAGHKGYGSADHIAAIREHGLSPAHRASFCKAFV